MAKTNIYYIAGSLVIASILIGGILLNFEINKGYASISRNGIELARENWLVIEEPNINLTQRLSLTTVKLTNLTTAYKVTKSAPYYKGTSLKGRIYEYFFFKKQTDRLEEFPKQYLVKWSPKNLSGGYQLVWNIFNIKDNPYSDGIYNQCQYTFGGVKVDLKNECSKLEKVLINENKANFYFNSINGIQNFDLLFVDPTDTPMINFTNPTPRNASIIWDTFLNLTNLINITINASIIDTFTFMFDITNYTIYNNSLVLMMNLDNVTTLDDSATKFVDVSKYSQNGTCVGTACPFINSSGKYNKALSFDGTTDFVDLGSSAALNIMGDLTIAGWVRTSETTIQGFLAKGPEGGSGATGYLTYIWSDGKIAFYSSGGGGFVFSTATVNDGLWHHIAIVLRGTSVSFYKDGVFSATAVSAVPLSTSGSGRIGRESTNGFYFKGSIDEVRVFNRSSFVNEINQSYYSNLYKYQGNTWNYITNQSNLVNGTYTYYGYVKNTAGNANFTETRTFCVNTSGGYTNDCPAPPSAPAGDTCTYTSGTWTVNWFDNCTITTNINLNKNSLIIDGRSGCGTFMLLGGNVSNANVSRWPHATQNYCNVARRGGNFR